MEVILDIKLQRSGDHSKMLCSTCGEQVDTNDNPGNHACAKFLCLCKQQMPPADVPGHIRTCVTALTFVFTTFAN